MARSKTYFATLLLENGVAIKTVQKRLVHASISTTSDIYSHVTEKMDREATNYKANMNVYTPKYALDYGLIIFFLPLAMENTRKNSKTIKFSLVFFP